MCMAEVSWGDFTLHVTEDKPHNKGEIYPSSIKKEQWCLDTTKQTLRPKWQMSNKIVQDYY